MSAGRRRLDQVLSSLGYASRREAKALVDDGRVSVLRDGGATPARRVDDKVLPGEVRLDGEPLEFPDGLLVLFHKPPGCVCSRDAAEGERVFDLLPPRWSLRNPAVMTVGRLDRDTTGALLVTDDGQLAHRLTSPRHHVEKVYVATLDQPLPPGADALLASGTLVLDGEDTPCLPARLRVLAPTRVELTLTEGRYHQVKRMMAAFGSAVTSLHRERFGPYALDGLAPGEWRVVGAG